jgi:hypothetical protein
VIPGRIEGANCTLGAPDGWDKSRDGSCSSLAIRAEAVESGRLLMESVWFPTPEEMVAIAAGAPVKLSVYGSGHPPVMLGVGDVPA